jgi:hypothetical protein
VSPLDELYTALHVSQTELHTSVGQLENWFRQAEPTEAPLFTFEELVRIGLMCVAKLHPDFDPDIAVASNSLPDFVQLSLFSDIFFIVFDNIRVHCGLRRPRVSVEAEVRDDRLRIYIYNTLANKVRSHAAQERVEEIKRIIEGGLYQRAVRSEGGTGLIKLRNILRSEASLPDQLNFGFHGNDGFFVELNVPLIAEADTTSTHGVSYESVIG